MALQKELAQLWRDLKSLLHNSSYTQFFFGFTPMWSIRYRVEIFLWKSQHWSLMPNVKLKQISVKNKEQRAAKSSIRYFWSDEIARTKKAVLSLVSENELVMLCGICSNQSESASAMQATTPNISKSFMKKKRKKHWINDTFILQHRITTQTTTSVTSM